jgi:aspartyl-tRNA(Asn)/glutamyl-tRNA(Gln) amidotransferase subunit A
MTLYGGEGGPFFAPLIDGKLERLHPFLQRRLTLPAPSLRDYMDAYAAWERLKHDTARFFGDHDLLLGPVSPLPAHAHGLAELTVDGKTVPGRHALRATLPWDLTGSPALALAYGWSRDELPIAVQLVGRHLDEATVLRAGLALEESSEVRGRRPPLA